MIDIKQIRKKDIAGLLDDQDFWRNPFLSVSRHRLYSHYHNPTSNDDDVVLLLAYYHGEIAGYMGVYIDRIVLDGKEDRIGWLSTWWVHPKTKGSGIGREILNTMYAVNEGKIGISQFTPSAKRVYDKSGYFNTLKENIGVKAVLKSNTASLVPQLYPKLNFLKPIFRLCDALANWLVGIRLFFQKRNIQAQLQNIKVEYVSTIDHETEALINLHNDSHISKKGAAFFNWLKTYNWVQDAPLLSLTEKDKYEFSMYDKSFDIYMVKILSGGKCIGFLVVQKRNDVFKVLFAYYDNKEAKTIANILKLQAIVQNIKEIICYDHGITNELRQSSLFLYKKKKVKHSIISKVFGKDNFDDVVMNFGDGDCSFA
jgi:GNAT superfamily N-acetyltransferase